MKKHKIINKTLKILSFWNKREEENRSEKKYLGKEKREREKERL